MGLLLLKCPSSLVSCLVEGGGERWWSGCAEGASAAGVGPRTGPVSTGASFHAIAVCAYSHGLPR